jgi:hypothetical protein
MSTDAVSADTDLRAAMIEVIGDTFIASDGLPWLPSAEDYADAILALLERWTAKEPE